jgi:hypothetical protein
MRIRSLIALAAVALCAALVAPTALAAGKNKEIDVKSQTGRGDEKMKPRPPNDPNAKEAAPRTRAGVCEVHVDNRTRWYIDVYIDGNFRGTVGPSGDGYALAISGPTRVYGRADFTDGTYKYWDQNISCPAGESRTVVWYP